MLEPAGIIINVLVTHIVIDLDQIYFQNLILL